ncbi:caspase family protein [Desulfosudis oleivorans]|uniref:Peptidase C14 caspase catalytic subunit p20 n=1 Tax=Desulfosudis oleivorans (strain DSM 6200 / JCM 39069 / Hxd3) TaxID=96561 RepID=A8ZTC6_DESOH|nr:caspase family protein [Desulfosudis oleivorans]ABW67809.1 peptidase C14 caspase catalytic subunit p20 [Desulfosudis oleivorans Hxd3]
MKKLFFVSLLLTVIIMLYAVALAGDCVDVSETHWAYPAIKKALPIMQLCTAANEYKFNGDELVNRYDIARFSTRILERWGFSPGGAEVPNDVPASHPDYEAVQKAISADILSAYDGKFYGDKLINRQQMAFVLSRLLNKKGIRASSAQEKHSFQDLSENHWAFEAVQHTVSAGILKGYSNKFYGNRLINRYQMAVIIARLGDLVPETFRTTDTLVERNKYQQPFLNAAGPEGTIREKTAPLDFGSYNALVIGNNDYRQLPKLRTAVNDAQAIALLLKDKYGFKVQLLTNATRADILTAINAYRRKLNSQDNLLIYYAGHGWLDKDADQGYWLPVDATRENPILWVSNSAVTAEIRAIQAKHILVVADSCYSGKLTRGLHITQKTPDYIARIVQKKARVVLSSGGLEPVLDSGGQENHSVFASAFIETLWQNKEVLDGTTLFTKIREQVGWNADQIPEYANIHKAGHAGGDFIFLPHE